MSFPLTIRMPYGGGVRAPELHDDSPETYYVHTPGVKVAIPSTPADAKGLLAAAIRDPDPVVVLEPKLHYRTAKEDVPDGEHVVPLGESRDRARGLRPDDRRVRRDGARRARGRRRARATRRRARCSTCASLKPLDEDGLLASVAKTGRVVVVQEAPRVCGFAAEVAAVLAEKAIFDLRGPVIRVTATTCRIRTGRSRTRTCRRSSASSTRFAAFSPPSGAARDPARAAHAPRPLLARPRADPDGRAGRLDRVLVPQRRLAHGGARAVSRATRGRARRRTRPDRADRGARRPGRTDARGRDRRGAHRLRAASRRPVAGRTPLNDRLGVDEGETVTLHWALDADAGIGRTDSGREVALAPFLGVIGMPPDEPGIHSTASAAPVRREHRLQGARRRDDAVPADPRRRRAALGGRRARRPGRRRGLAARDRGAGRAGAAHALRA